MPPNPLFVGVTEAEQNALFECLKARERSYGKGEELLREQEPADRLGVILTGDVEASRLDISGRRLVISRLGPGSVFGDVLSLYPERPSPVTVTALGSVSALLLPAAGLLEPCAKHCAGHEKLIRNLLRSVSAKYFELHDRLYCITRATMREKIMFYLESASESSGKDSRGRIFTIPFDRSALAGYLNVERSALSRELSAMKRDGLIDYHRNSFRLL